MNNYTAYIFFTSRNGIIILLLHAERLVIMNLVNRYYIVSVYCIMCNHANKEYVHIHEV